MMTRLTVAAALALSSCMAVRSTPPLDFARLSEMRPGVSTLADARAIYGAPKVASHSAMGACYMWTAVQVGALSGPESQAISICFDDAGKYQGQRVPTPAAQ